MKSISQTQRAVLYARVSSEEQARSGYSLTQQLEALRAYAEARGYEIVEEITDPGESGAYLERPGFDRVRDLVREGGVDVVLAQDRDRFAREPAYLYLLQEGFNRYGARLEALNARGDDTPEGQLTEGMLDQLAKYERAKIAERTRRGRLEKARRGGIRAGRIPKFGFKINASRDGYEIDPQTMPTAERIIRAVAQGHSMHGLARTLTREKVPTAYSGKTWSTTFIRRLIKDDAYLPHSFEELETLVAPEVINRLDPERHYGIVWHNRTLVRVVEKIKVGPDKYKTRRKFTERPRHEWIGVPLPAPPNLDRVTVERARARISGNIRPAASGARMWELSGGLLMCGHCGRRMLGHNSQVTGVGGVRRPFYYYVCTRKLNDGSAACENRYHRAGDLEQTVMEAVSRLLSNPTTLFQQIDEKIEAEKGIARDPHREIAALGKQLDKLATKRSRYTDLYAEGTIATKEELGEKLAKVDEERKAVEEAIASAKDRRGNIKILTYQKQAILLLYALFAKEALTDFSPEHRRAMYERIGLRVTAYKDRDPEIELTLDPHTLPPPDEAREAFAEMASRASVETLEGVYRKFLGPPQVLDEETGEWVPAEDPEAGLEAEAEYEDLEAEDLPFVSKDSTSGSRS